MDRSPKELAPPQELIDFAERHIRNASVYSKLERREQKRHFIVVPVVAVPVDEQFQPIGDAVALVTRDISSKGIGLVHFEPLSQGLLAIRMRLAGDEVNVVIEIGWSKPLGPFELSGGRFVAKLESFPEQNRSQEEAGTGRPTAGS